jgi:hypothetical protein
MEPRAMNVIGRFKCSHGRAELAAGVKWWVNNR